jgi:hypothetical protein
LENGHLESPKKPNIPTREAENTCAWMRWKTKWKKLLILFSKWNKSKLLVLKKTFKVLLFN